MNFVESEMLRMIEIAAACVRHSSAKRPRMGQVIEFNIIYVISDVRIQMHGNHLSWHSYASHFSGC